MIKELRLSFEFDNNGELEITFRRQILLDLNNSPNGGNLSRCHLAMDCAAKVYPIWTEAFTDRKPFDFLNSIIVDFRENQNLQGEAYRSSFKNFFDDLDERFEGVDPASFASIYAGYTALYAARVFIEDDWSISQYEKEIDLGEEFWGTAFYASCAFCGSAVWDKLEESKKRRIEFWNWYISRYKYLMETDELIKFQEI